MSRLIKCIVMFAGVAGMIFYGCKTKTDAEKAEVSSVFEQKLSSYASFTLTTELSVLSENERRILPYLLQASRIIDEIYWAQVCRFDRQTLCEDIEDEFLKRYIEVNYGPWDRLDGMKPFIEDIGPRPLGAQFYPEDMSFDEFQAMKEPQKYSQYTILRRNEFGSLISIPYHQAYEEKITEVVNLLQGAAEISENEEFKKYLLLRAKAMSTDQYFESEVAWMEMNDHILDFVIGPIEASEDRLFWNKAVYGALILVKDEDWSEKLERFTLLLPYLQRVLPVTNLYKAEMPGMQSQIGVYDAIYYSGNWNAGSKKIAVTLPLDDQIHFQIGSRKLQFKNVMQAKFEKILKPIGEIVISPEQRKHVKFNAFFENTLFYEVSQSLGMKNTVNRKGTVKDALRDYHSIIEESKADILSLFVVTKLHEMGQLEDSELMDNYVTSVADIFRSVRFGIANDQGIANMIRFYYFLEKGAIQRDNKTNTYFVDSEKMKNAMLELSKEILVIQGDGDFESARSLVNDKGYIRDELHADLIRILRARIPKDIIFEQGEEVLGI
jgi:hypothetical protein